jgi:FSR family fosmidomycin resistance protein-like MFS transporter
VRRVPIALAVAAHAIVDTAQNILPVVLPVLMDRLQLTYTQVGAAAALLNISSSVIQPGFGWLSDRWATRWFMPVGIAWTGVLMGSVGYVSNYAALLVVIFLTGIGTAAFHPVASISVGEASGARRGLGMSLFSAGGNLGFALGPVLAAWLVAQFGLTGTAWVLLPCLVMTGGMLVAWREFQAQPHLVRETAREGERPIPWGGLAILCAAITLRSWGYSGLAIFIPLWLRTRGMALSEAGWALFAFLFCGALGGMIGGHLSDRVGRDGIIKWSLLAFPVLMSTALFGPGWIQMGALMVAGGSLMASFSVTVVLAQEMLPGHVGLASGLTLGLAFGAGGMGVGISGMVADWVGLDAAMWMLMGLPGLAGVLAMWLPLKETEAE